LGLVEDVGERKESIFGQPFVQYIKLTKIYEDGVKGFQTLQKALDRGLLASEFEGYRAELDAWWS
jgi:hypothetical protein